jgi:hypothetical protein
VLLTIISPSTKTLIEVNSTIDKRGPVCELRQKGFEVDPLFPGPRSTFDSRSADWLAELYWPRTTSRPATA